jgi:hypothetical protein
MDMASIDQEFGLAAEFPQLRLPNKEVADSGVVRLGNGFVSANFPELRLPSEEIADSGIVRLGNGFISANFPSNSRRS